MRPPALDEAALLEALQHLPHWQYNPPALEATFHFADEQRCLRYLAALNQEADRLDHHPQILRSGNAVTLRWWTHSVQAITALDVQAAELSETLASTLR